MDKVADFFKVFIEKHLIPTVIAIAGAITTLLILPDNNWMIVKIGDLLFLILAFCLYFLLVQLLIKIGRFVKTLPSKADSNKYYTEQREKSNQEAIQHINEFVDSLSPEDKNTLLTFVKNGNKILISYNHHSSFDSMLENTNIVNHSAFRGNIAHIDESIYWIAPSLKDIYAQGMRPIEGLSQYKIKDSIFHDLKLIYELNGKLGNF